MFGYAQKYFDQVMKDASTSEGEKEELKKLIRIALSNKIKILRLGEGDKIEFDFSIHPCFPAISLSKK